jgi:response regulator RpfG family c-di-GMP phosphodiesterase
MPNLRVFKNTFRREYTVLTANSADEGFKLLSENFVDILVTDQKMPGMTGTEFLCKLREQYPNRPPTRIPLCAYAKSENIEEAIEKCNVSMFVSKPWSPDQMRSIFTSIMKDSKQA